MITAQEIFSILKQKSPFLFVDKVLEIEKGKRMVAVKNVTANEFFMPCHFPGNSVLPGVLIIETVAQTTALLCSLSEGLALDDESKFLALGGVQRFNFLRVVKPGDVLITEVEIIKAVPNAAIVKAVVKVDASIVAEGQMTFGVTKGD